MREDQFQRLRELEEKLADVVLEEADPDLWPGAGVPLADMTQQQRGDRFWSKRNAAATFALLERTSCMFERRPAGTQNPAEAEEDIEKQIRQRENEAAKLLDRALKKAKKTAFDERMHGK